jgi:hypothetical protein
LVDLSAKLTLMSTEIMQALPFGTAIGINEILLEKKPSSVR